MQVFIDNKVLKIINQFSEKDLIEFLKQIDTLEQNINSVNFGWPSLLEMLDLNSIFENFPVIEQREIFNHIMATLPLKPEKETLFGLYDYVFAECLTQIKALPEIQCDFLIEHIQKTRKTLISFEKKKLFENSLEYYEKLFIEHPANTMHDLILYLAWDRVCVCFAHIFEYEVAGEDIANELKVFYECLLESFQHITAHGRTTPGFFRLIETLFAYQMKKENLETHSDEDWTILCQSAKALRPREKLNDVFYIDAAIIHDQNIPKLDNQDHLIILTLDKVDKVKASLALAKYMLKKLKTEALEWHYLIKPTKIICFEQGEDNKLTVKEMITTEKSTFK